LQWFDTKHTVFFPKDNIAFKKYSLMYLLKI
jgi:hypothetical protein